MLFYDPHAVNFIMPASDSLERVALPMHFKDGPNQSNLRVFLLMLRHIHKHDPSRHVFIEAPSGQVCIAPVILKYDGSTVAGGLHLVGSGELAELIGAKMRITMRGILEWVRAMPAEDGDGEESSDGSEDQEEADVQRVDAYVRRIAPKLIRSADAWHIQSLTDSVFVHYGDFGHTQSTAVAELSEDQRVTARPESAGPRGHYHPAVVTRVYDGGFADVLFDDPTKGEQLRLPRGQIRDEKEQQHEVVLEENLWHLFSSLALEKPKKKLGPTQLK